MVFIPRAQPHAQSLTPTRSLEEAELVMKGVGVGVIDQESGASRDKADEPVGL